MGFLEDAWNTVKDVGSTIVDTVKEDAKDLVQASSFLPMDVLLNGATNGGYRDLKNEAFRAIGVSEDDIKDMDYRNHSVLDNARALGNSLFNVGSTLVGAPAAGTAIKAGAQAGKAGVKAAKGSYHIAKGSKNVAEGIKAAAKPSNWTKTTNFVKTSPGKTEIWKKPVDYAYKAVPGQPVQRVAKGRVIMTDKDGSKYIPIIRRTEQPTFKMKTSWTNPKAKQALGNGGPVVKQGMKEMGQAAGQGLEAVRTISKQPKSLALFLPGAQNAEEVERRTKAGRKTFNTFRRIGGL